MSKELLQKHTKYAESLRSRLSDKTLPEKHKNRPVEYKQFLERELQAVTSKIEFLRTGVSDKK